MRAFASKRTQLTFVNAKPASQERTVKEIRASKILAIMEENAHLKKKFFHVIVLMDFLENSAR